MTVEPHRVRMSDVAEAVGVSVGAVSFALNDRPGVSAETRRRIIDAAIGLGWTPRRPMRRPSERAYAVGLALQRRASTLALQSFYSQFVAGVESVLMRSSFGLLWQIVGSTDEELELYRRWARRGTVDGVILADVSIDDVRVERLSRPGALPAVVAADASVAGGLSAVSVPDDEAMEALMRRLVVDLGHRHVLRISGPEGAQYTSYRDRAMLDAAGARGAIAQIERSDLSPRAAAAMTREALLAPRRPTALIYETDVMALAGLGVIRELGLRCPADVSVIAWDDSPLCAVGAPPLSAVGFDVLGYGAATAQALLDRIDDDVVSRRTLPVHRLVERATTGPVPGRRQRAG